MKKMVLHVVVFVMIIGLYGFGASKLSPEERILARVGDWTVTQIDLDELIKRYESIRKGNPYGLDEKKELVNMLIKNTLLSMEAEREKLDQKPEFQSRLKMVKNELLVREYISQKIEPFVTAKNEEVEEILKQNPNLIPKETVTIKEILVKTEKEAEEIYQELKKGADFSKIAAEKSISQTKTKEGLIGTISRGQLPPPLEAVVFSLKEGEFSKPIKMDQGFEIFYLVSRKEMDPEQIKVLEGKLREKIIQVAKSRKMEAMIEKKIEELKKQIKVETYFDQLK
jgi:parvulin-like peptidyl-prolyl isomerase